MGKCERSKVGLLGGSFNPAHVGHVYASQKAIELLGLTEVWWLVSPQNPLKSVDGMLPYEERYERSCEVAGVNDKIIVSDFEMKNGTSRTYETLNAIKKEYKDNRFMWLMGLDNLESFHHWYRWNDILLQVPVVVINRPCDVNRAWRSEMVTKYCDAQVDFKKFGDGIYENLPVWCFLDVEVNPMSSTEIRNNV